MIYKTSRCYCSVSWDSRDSPRHSSNRIIRNRKRTRLAILESSSPESSDNFHSDMPFSSHPLVFTVLSVYAYSVLGYLSYACSCELGVEYCYELFVVWSRGIASEARWSVQLVTYTFLGVSLVNCTDKVSILSAWYSHELWLMICSPILSADNPYPTLSAPPDH